MSNKLEQHDWQIKNEDEIINEFLENYDDEIKDDIFNFIKGRCHKNMLAGNLSMYFNTSKELQYQQYLDTEEFDHMKEGRGER